MLKRISTRRALLGASFLALSAISYGWNADISRAQPAASTATANAPVLRASIFKVVRDSQGRETFVSAEKVRPGDLLEYRVRLTNSSTRNLSRVQASLPIPAALVFVESSARPAGALASLNGSSYSAMPLKRQVRDANGNLKTVAVPLSEYRSLRWTVKSLAAGGTFEAKARARLRSTAANSTSVSQGGQ